MCGLQVLNIGGQAHSLGPLGLAGCVGVTLGRWQDGGSSNLCFSVSWETFPSSPLGGGLLRHFSRASTGSHPVEVPLRHRLVMSIGAPSRQVVSESNQGFLRKGTSRALDAETLPHLSPCLTLRVYYTSCLLPGCLQVQAKVWGVFDSSSLPSSSIAI